MVRSHPVLAIVTATYLLLIIVLTFAVSTDSHPPSPWWSLLVFIGVGGLLCALLTPHRWWAALGFGMLGAAWVEAAQSVWLPPGYANLFDLVLGLLGTAIGVAAVAAVKRLHDIHTAHEAAHTAREVSPAPVGPATN